MIALERWTLVRLWKALDCFGALIMWDGIREAAGMIKNVPHQDFILCGFVGRAVAVRGNDNRIV